LSAKRARGSLWASYIYKSRYYTVSKTGHVKAIWLYMVFFTLVALSASAQPVSNWRQQIVHPPKGLIFSDSLTIVPGSVRAFPPGSEAPLNRARLRIRNNRILLDSTLLRYDSVEIRYRVLPYNLGQSYRHLDTAQAQPLEDGVIGIAYNPYEQEEELLNFRGLNYNGNFTRGISFGNNQDLVLNSSFNLQLAGELGDGIEILAAITDENIPIQPEGNTQQLREFDRLFIQLQKDSNRLIAGDYELRRPNSYFMNYFKKLQGATFSNSRSLGKGRLRSKASIAISRGQFTRNRIEAQEGNQGPYKLRGAEGERFIIVLSGTEKVFLDGQLMVRGLEQDYIIDYNRGEVTFTNKQLITKDSRITVEFEYADQSYVRSLYALNTAYERGKLRLDVNFFNQQDSKNATGELGLTDATKQLLSEAGDAQAATVVPSIDTLEEFTPFRVAYRLEDTLISCGLRDTLVQYLSFTTEPQEPLYTARFSFVGEGNGQYVLAPEQTANERVYRWVGLDDNCQPLGDFSPVTPVTPPRQQQLLTVGGSYQLSEASAVTAEVAMSRNDLNRFSRLDSGDDLGFSAYTNFRHTFQLGREETGWTLGTQGSYEWRQQNFEPLNPYRNPEFLRDWSLADVQGRGAVEAAQEQIGKGGLELRKAGLGTITYELSGFRRDSLYAGWRHQWRLRENAEDWEVQVDGSLLQSERQGERNRFLRPRATLAYTLPWLGGLKLGAYGEQERNERYAPDTDTLSANSFYYNRYRFFLESGQAQEGRSWGSSYSQRIDYAPIGEAFQTSTIATEANVNGKWQWLGSGNRLRLAGNFTYRRLEIRKPEAVSQEPGETFLGRGDLNFTVLKGVVQSATTYEIGSGQEAKVEFTYLRVNPGEGDYIWLDSLYNNDGIIQPNEMEIAPFQDLANYVRVTTVTDEFIRTDNVRLNQSLRLSPKAVWFQEKGWKKFLGRFSTISNLSINRKTQEAEDIAAWNPFQLDVADTSLVAVSSNIRHVLFFNQADPVYDLQLGMSDNRNKTVQTSGFESRRRSEQFLRGRWNISKALSTTAHFTLGQRSSDSEFFNEKDFDIHFFQLSPAFTFLPSRNFRATLTYEFQQDEDRLEGGDAFSERHEFELEARYNRSAKTSVQLRTSFVKVAFNGQPNSPVGFAILNGLQQGQNFLWNLSLDQQMAKNIQLRLSYEGRKTGEAQVVHTGRAQVAANF
jgi:hypothetical protein